MRFAERIVVALSSLILTLATGLLLLWLLT